MKFRAVMLELAPGVPGRLYDGWGLGSALQDRAQAVAAGYAAAAIWIVRDNEPAPPTVHKWDTAAKALGAVEAGGLPF